jgi:hypothetical protein
VKKTQPVTQTTASLRIGASVVDSCTALSYEGHARSEEKMTRRFSDLLILMFLGLGIALAPIACGSDDDGTRDGAVDQMTPS